MAYITEDYSLIKKIIEEEVERLGLSENYVPALLASAGADPNDPTGAGGGTIGTGQVSVPGEQGFTGNEQPQGTPQQTQGAGEQPQDVGTPQ